MGNGDERRVEQVQQEAWGPGAWDLQQDEAGLMF